MTTGARAPDAHLCDRSRRCPAHCGTETGNTCALLRRASPTVRRTAAGETLKAEFDLVLERLA